MIDRLAGRKVYLDANVVIFALEAQYVDLCRVILQGIERNELRACTSELTLAETLARPIRENRLDLAQVYEQALQSGDSLSVVPISRSILIQSARLRALTRGRLPDSIHLATAVEAKCDVVITGDKSFKTSRQVMRMTLDDLLQ